MTHNGRATLRAILLACLIFCSSAQAAGIVQFYFFNAIGAAEAGGSFILTPYAINLVATGFADTSPMSFSLDAYGQCTVTGLVAGTYIVREANSTFQINVTNSASAYNATNIITGLQIPGATSVFTRTQSDARYYIIPSTNGFASLATNSSPAPVTVQAWGNTNANDVNIWLLGGTNIVIFDPASNIVEGPFNITNIGYPFHFPVQSGGGVTNSSISFTWHAR